MLEGRAAEQNLVFSFSEISTAKIFPLYLHSPTYPASVTNNPTQEYSSGCILERAAVTGHSETVFRRRGQQMYVKVDELGVGKRATLPNQT